MLCGVNTGYQFILNCDPKEMTKEFILENSDNQEIANGIKDKLYSNWKNIKNEIYLLSRFNLMEVIIKYISNIIIFMIVSIIISNDKYYNDIYILWLVARIRWIYPMLHHDIFVKDKSIINEPKNKRQETYSNYHNTNEHVRNTSEWKE